MNRLFGLIAPLLMAGSVVTAQPLDARFVLLPQPQEVTVLSQRGITAHDLSFVVAHDSVPMPVMGATLEALPRVAQQGRKGVTLVMTTHGVPASDEGYVLTVQRQGVTIQSRGAAGLFYGCHTLEQLLTDSREQDLTIPLMTITDFPSISYRAVYFDTKHHLDDVNYYYRLIDKLSHYKINAIIWEIEDKLRYARRPEVASPNAISLQQMQSLSRYAKERHIEISPLVQGLGHASFVLKHHWELREDPLSDWEFCPSDDRTYELQFDLYRDALSAMPHGRFLHVGGDEITAIGIDSRCTARGMTPLQLQMEWLQRVSDFALSHGRTPIFWDDMPIKSADLWGLLHRNLSDSVVLASWNTAKLDSAVKLFPKECVYMRWHYDDPTTLPHRLLLDWYKGTDLRVMAATSASTGNDPFMPRLNSRAQYIKDFSTLTMQNNLVGILCTVWDDGSAHWETVMRGLIAQGEYAWNPLGRSVPHYLAAHSWREFGLPAQASSFIQDMEQVAAFFDHALVVKGSRNPAWGAMTDFQLIDLPSEAKPGEWTRTYRQRLDSAQVAHEMHGRIVAQQRMAHAAARRNRYTLEVYEVTAQLFDYPAQVLLALEAYDSAIDAEQRHAAVATIEAVCKGFDALRANLINVYGRTRFMQNPDGYIADMNHHHHLAAITHNSDWIFLYELPMTKLLREWLADKQ